MTNTVPDVLLYNSDDSIDGKQELDDIYIQTINTGNVPDDIEESKNYIKLEK